MRASFRRTTYLTKPSYEGKALATGREYCVRHRGGVEDHECAWPCRYVCKPALVVMLRLHILVPTLVLDLMLGLRGGIDPAPREDAKLSAVCGSVPVVMCQVEEEGDGAP